MNGLAVVHDGLGSPAAIGTPDPIGLGGIKGDHGRTAAVAVQIVGSHGYVVPLPVGKVKSERIDG